MKSYVPASQAQCAICGGEAEMLTEAEAMQILGVSEEVLHARIAAGQIHAVLKANGASRICKNSLSPREALISPGEIHGIEAALVQLAFGKTRFWQ